MKEDLEKPESEIMLLAEVNFLSSSKYLKLSRYGCSFWFWQPLYRENGPVECSMRWASMGSFEHSNRELLALLIGADVFVSHGGPRGSPEARKQPRRAESLSKASRTVLTSSTPIPVGRHRARRHRARAAARRIGTLETTHTHACFYLPSKASCCFL